MKSNNFDINELIASLPAGLDRAVLRVLSYHVGRKSAIGRSRLVGELLLLGFRVNERAARAQISQLRKAGNLICSAPGESGGYYLPADRAEYEEFKRQEYEAKIIDMHETLRAMDKAAERQWGLASQPSLFG